MKLPSNFGGSTPGSATTDYAQMLINLAGAKNMVGAFWQPAGVLIDTSTLTTLGEREYRAGFCSRALCLEWREASAAANGFTLARLTCRLPLRCRCFLTTRVALARPRIGPCTRDFIRRHRAVAATHRVEIRRSTTVGPPGTPRSRRSRPARQREAQSGRVWGLAPPHRTSRAPIYFRRVACLFAKYHSQRQSIH